jgi:hypothetical protein
MGSQYWDWHEQFLGRSWKPDRNFVTDWYPINAYGAITHSYGGATAFELGIAPLGPLVIGVSPFGYSSPINSDRK